jgi:hypothetical protein
VTTCKRLLARGWDTPLIKAVRTDSVPDYPQADGPSTTDGTDLQFLSRGRRWRNEMAIVDALCGRLGRLGRKHLAHFLGFLFAPEMRSLGLGFLRDPLCVPSNLVLLLGVLRTASLQGTILLRRGRLGGHDLLAGATHGAAGGWLWSVEQSIVRGLDKRWTHAPTDRKQWRRRAGVPFATTPRTRLPPSATNVARRGAPRAWPIGSR